MTTGRINQVSHRVVACSDCSIPRPLSPPRSPSAACSCTNSLSDYSCTHTPPSPTAHRDRLLRLPASPGQSHTLIPPHCPLDGSAADAFLLSLSRLCCLVDQRCLPHESNSPAAPTQLVVVTRSRLTPLPAQLRLPRPRARRPAGLVSLPPASRPSRLCPDQLAVSLTVPSCKTTLAAS